MNRAGFTLVEIVTVIVVMGIAAAVAVPALRRSRGASVGAAARELRSVYADARSLSARRGVPVMVILETATDSFAVFAEPEDGARELIRAGALPLPPDGSITGGHDGRATVCFTPLGRARADAVTLSDGDAREYVDVNTWTGASSHAAR